MSAKDLPSTTPLGVDQDGRGRPLHPVRPHRLGDGAASRVRCIYAHGEANPVLVQESAERFEPHGVMVLEDGVEAHDHKVR